MKTLAAIAAACLLATSATVATADDNEVPAVLNFKMKTLAGKDVELSKYNGKVILFVNVASFCGYTDQYDGLEALNKKYAEKGLAVIGVPCNQFGEQEPGTAQEIAKFCKESYGVTFDLLEKVDVNGDGQCDLYKFLTSKDTNPKHAGPIGWNFEKFLVARDGTVVARYKSDVEPNSDDLVKAIEAELAK